MGFLPGTLFCRHLRVGLSWHSPRLGGKEGRKEVKKLSCHWSRILNKPLLGKHTSHITRLAPCVGPTHWPSLAKSKFHADLSTHLDARGYLPEEHYSVIALPPGTFGFYPEDEGLGEGGRGMGMGEQRERERLVSMQKLFSPTVRSSCILSFTHFFVHSIDHC